MNCYPLDISCLAKGLMGQNKPQVCHKQRMKSMCVSKQKRSPICEGYSSPHPIPFHALSTPEWSHSRQEVRVMQHEDSTSRKPDEERVDQVYNMNPAGPQLGDSNTDHEPSHHSISIPSVCNSVFKLSPCWRPEAFTQQAWRDFPWLDIVKYGNHHPALRVTPAAPLKWYTANHKTPSRVFSCTSRCPAGTPTPKLFQNRIYKKKKKGCAC